MSFGPPAPDARRGGEGNIHFLNYKSLQKHQKKSNSCSKGFTQTKDPEQNISLVRLDSPIFSFAVIFWWGAEK